MTTTELRSKIKSPIVAYLLFLFLRAHHLYLEKYDSFFIMLVLHIACAACLFNVNGTNSQVMSLITISIFGVLFIWWMYDLVSMIWQVKEYNKDIFAKIEVLEKKSAEDSYRRNLEMIREMKKE